MRQELELFQADTPADLNPASCRPRCPPFVLFDQILGGKVAWIPQIIIFIVFREALEY